MRAAAILFILVFGSSVAFAQSAERTPEYYECTQADLMRTVRVVYPESGENVCEVLYAKPTEGVEETAQWWASAEANIGYCSRQAKEFLDRLGNLGWSCETRDPEEAE